MDQQNEERADERYQLRSEKVRSIIGQVPPLLTRYGITMLAVAVAALLLAARLIPYRQVYRGEAIVYEVPLCDEDSVTLRLRVRLDGTPADPGAISGIILSDPSGMAVGTDVRVSAHRDTLGYRTVLARFACPEVRPMAATTLPCTITTDAGPYLYYLFGM
ncbi:MAG: hypothetical protein SPI16_05745 [Porphyromonas sp.]|uniref:hypothetical protein n=1 Tax=Porphyromonas sp. TaxID=1924944 RepID=UPI002A90A0F9|nr:hypothetical protein [Porphyromonas sp.]MDD7469043.1 hypothetical protein [Bacteroidales bacterium]MDY6102533.1 hypothetical protein [Porphyromonas sp.]